MGSRVDVVAAMARVGKGRLGSSPGHARWVKSSLVGLVRDWHGEPAKARVACQVLELLGEEGLVTKRSNGSV